MGGENATFEKIRKTPCLVCRSTPCDVAHIKTQGSGGSDEAWNLMPICRRHHSEQHTIGILSFSSKYLQVATYMADHGWFIHNGKLLNERFITGESLPEELKG
jgi:hypothetical protein